MAYATSNPPQCLVQGVAGPSLWVYVDGDAHGDVDATDYFSNGDALGMKEDDIVIVNDNNVPTCTIHRVNAVTSGGAATLSAATLA
jgi:hypothetical protein